MQGLSSFFLTVGYRPALIARGTTIKSFALPYFYISFGQVAQCSIACAIGQVAAVGIAAVPALPALFFTRCYTQAQQQ
jgi:hypothetical protein